MSELLDAAVAYAERGWPVFPLYTWRNGRCSCGQDECASPAKHPHRELAPNGNKNATTSVDRVHDWWTRFPTANIGLRTGDVFDVLDVDGDEGENSLHVLQEEHGVLPTGPVVITGGNGLHYFFKATGTNNKAGFAPKLDWRGTGGYVVAAPSLHRSGQRYRWSAGPEEDIPDVPEWLATVLNPPKPERQAQPERNGGIRYLAVPGQGTPYGIAALESELEELARATEGSRNHELNLHGFNLFQLVAGGELVEGFVEGRLLETAVRIGLSEFEARNTIASARKGGMANPRYAPALPERLAANGSQVSTWTPPVEREGPPQESPVLDENAPKPDRNIDDFLNSPDPEYDWLVPGLLERGDRLILTGPEGGGKSTLLRQWCIQLGGGIHPFGGPGFEPLNVLLLDLENSERQVRRKIRPLRIAAGHDYDPDHVRIRVVPQGVNLASAVHQEWLDRRLEANKPDVLLVGPLYKLADGDPTEEKVAKPVAVFLDHMRAKHGIAIIIEAHTPHASTPGGRRPERPYGWSGWLRWPEFGIHLTTEGGLTHWRGQRDEREWPALLKRGGEWPWTPVTDAKAVTFARILEVTREAGAPLSVRELERRLQCSKSTIDRCIKANQNQYDALLAELGE